MIEWWFEFWLLPFPCLLLGVVGPIRSTMPLYFKMPSLAPIMMRMMMVMDEGGNGGQNRDDKDVYCNNYNESYRAFWNSSDGYCFGVLSYERLHQWSLLQLDPVQHQKALMSFDTRQLHSSTHDKINAAWTLIQKEDKAWNEQFKLPNGWLWW